MNETGEDVDTISDRTWLRCSLMPDTNESIDGAGDRETDFFFGLGLSSGCGAFGISTVIGGGM